MEKQKILENTWIRALLWFCAIAAFLVVCYYLKGILISLFLAFTVAYIVDPLVDLISKRRFLFSKHNVPRSLAIAILLVGMILLSGGIAAYTIPKTVNGVQRVGVVLKKQYPKYQEKVERIIENYKDTEIAAFLKAQLSMQTDSEKGPQEKRPKVLKYVFAIIKNIFHSTFGLVGIVMNIVVFGVVTIYLLKDFDVIIMKCKGLLPVSKKEKIYETFGKINENLQAFLRGQITVCIILSILYGIGLTVIGVPLSYLIAIMGGFGNVIPYIGIMLGLIPALILTFIQYQDITHLLLVGMVFGIGQFFEGTIITPKIVGTKLGLHPVAIILSILICSQILGFLGLLLAVPIAAVTKVLIDEGLLKYKNTNFFKSN
ncbi:MAG: AI-2E family transporter [Candidatus Kuenenia sp.]|nr:AI-2E family transporter [Candidatus Kuenenia hertensis]